MTAAEEHGRRFEEAFELKLQFIELTENLLSGVSGGEPGATGSRGESGKPTKGAVSCRAPY